MPKLVEAARNGPLQGFPPEIAGRVVPLTISDLTAVRAGFGRRLPNSPWCGFASWEETRTGRRDGGAANGFGRRTRVAFFTPIEGRRRLLLTRFDDGRLALRDETGRTVAMGHDIDALIAAVEYP